MIFSAQLMALCIILLPEGKLERDAVLPWARWRTGSNRNDPQEHVCKTVCLFSALSSLHAAKSLRRKVTHMMRNE